MTFILVSWLIATIFIVIAVTFFRKNFVWWEYAVLAIAPLLLSGIIYSIDTSFRQSDLEFFSNQTVKVEYYEYWETYVHKTCTRSYDCNCSTDSKGHKSCSTCHETYDCSYCDHNPARYIAYNESGKSKAISESEYKRIAKKFGTERFVELNRNINKWGSCGKDGDMYVAEWNGDQEKFEIFATEHTYENKIRLSDSYGFRKLTKQEKSLIHEYPPVNSVYQASITGNWYNMNDYYRATFLLDRFNGKFGKSKQIKAFIFTYYNKPPNVADLQRIYFQNGNKNEIIICVGYTGSQATWVKAFSWTDEKVCENEAVRYFQPNMTLTGLVEHMMPVWEKNWVRKQFTPYNEIINIQPSTTGWVIMVVLNLILCAILGVSFKNNEYQNYQF
jgi:hypothetical protein